MGDESSCPINEESTLRLQIVRYSRVNGSASPSSKDSNHAQLERTGYCRGAIIDAELVEDVGHVRRRRAVTDEQGIADFAAGAAVGEQANHLDFARGQARAARRRAPRG